MSRSSNANRYGTLAERHLCDLYDLTRDGVHTYWCDAVDGDGTPWELKAAMIERADGSEGRFRIFEEAHDQLAAKRGWYGFAAYRPWGNGIQLVESTAFSAGQLPGSTWYGAGGHRDSQQRKLAVSEVFG